ncbi:hypothetical protein AB0J90_14290 [Micromonospora sp. NPDC049523]|uniref:hypothetical protein n=1 Tax=Micromonospora sp. NPDC049523 TaxID=3155921 RepID=UPI0034191FDC
MTSEDLQHPGQEPDQAAPGPAGPAPQGSHEQHPPQRYASTPPPGYDTGWAPPAPTSGSPAATPWGAAPVPEGSEAGDQWGPPGTTHPESTGGWGAQGSAAAGTRPTPTPPPLPPEVAGAQPWAPGEAWGAPEPGRASVPTPGATSGELPQRERGRFGADEFPPDPSGESRPAWGEPQPDRTPQPGGSPAPIYQPAPAPGFSPAGAVPLPPQEPRVPGASLAASPPADFAPPADYGQPAEYAPPGDWAPPSGYPPPGAFPPPASDYPTANPDYAAQADYPAPTGWASASGYPPADDFPATSGPNPPTDRPTRGELPDYPDAPVVQIDFPPSPGYPRQLNYDQPSSYGSSAPAEQPSYGSPAAAEQPSYGNPPDGFPGTGGYGGQDPVADDDRGAGRESDYGQASDGAPAPQAWAPEGYSGPGTDAPQSPAAAPAMPAVVPQPRSSSESGISGRVSMPRTEQPEPAQEADSPEIRAAASAAVPVSAAVSASAAVSGSASVPLASRVMPPTDQAVRSSAMPTPQPRVYGRPAAADPVEEPEQQVAEDAQRGPNDPSAHRSPNTYGTPTGYPDSSGYPEATGYAEPSGFAPAPTGYAESSGYPEAGGYTEPPAGYPEPPEYAEPAPRRGPTTYGGAAAVPVAGDEAERPVSPAGAPQASGAARVPAPQGSGFDAPPPGFDPQPGGFDGPQGGFPPPSAGFDGPPSGYAPAPTAGFDGPPPGYDNPPRGFEPAQGGSPQYPGMGGGAPFGDLLGERPNAMPGSPATGSARPSGPGQFGQPAVSGGAGMGGFDDRTSVSPVVPAPALPAMPPPAGTAAWPTQAPPNEPTQNRFDAFKPDAEEVKTEPAPTPQVRNGRVLLMVLTAAVLLLAIPLGALWFIGQGGEPTFNPAVGECVKQSGDGAVGVACTEPGSFTVVSKVASEAECADQALPKVIIPTDDGKQQVLCLRPTAGG